MELPQFSYSKIATFLECPKRYAFQYIQGVPTIPRPYFSFGTSIHNTLKDFHSYETCCSFEHFTEIYRNQWIKETGYKSPAEEQEYYELGLAILKAYHQKMQIQYIKPIIREERFQLNYETYLLNGAIDRVDRTEEDIIEVIDYKTSRRKTSQSELKNNLQLAVYGLATREIIGRYPDRLSYYFLRFNEKVSFKPHTEYFHNAQSRLNVAINSILEAHKGDDFPAQPNRLCIYCDYYSQCPEGNRSQPTIEKYKHFDRRTQKSKSTFEELSQKILNDAGEEIIEQQLQLLRQHFPFDHFRPGQLEVILSTLLNREVLAVMPTGGGKSLCYQLLSLQVEGLTVVISPLIALMKDQVEGIRELGFKNATFLNTSLGIDKYRQRISNILRGEVKLVYLAPEAMRNRNTVRTLEQRGVSLLVIDEAHCISQWGHDFRPDYLNLKSLRGRWSDCLLLAMTATATPKVQQDIMQQLSSTDMSCLVTSIDRPNLFLEVVHVLSDRDKQDKLYQLLEDVEGDGVIYVNTRKHAESLSQLIQIWGYQCDYYHAGLPRSKRSKVQDKFMKGDLPLVVSTNAFGMGVDKSDIRFIIHYHLPGSLEAYYQEIGRAGRDGAQSRTILFYSESDRGIQQYFVESSTINELSLKHLMHEMKDYRVGDYLLIPHGLLEKATGLDDTQIRVAISQMEKEKIFVRLPDISLELVITKNHYGYERDLEEKDHEFFVDLSKIIGADLEQGVRVHLKYLSEKLNMSPDAVEEALLTLKFYNVVQLKTVTRGFALRLFKQRSPTSISTVARGLENVAREKLTRLEVLIRYCLTPICRRYVIKEYFEDPIIEERCGFCDNCRGGQPVTTELFEEETPGAIPLTDTLKLVQLLRFPVGRNRLAEILAGSRKKIIIERNFHLLPQYASLKSFSSYQIKDFITMLIRAGYLDIYYRPDDSLHRYPLIRSTGEGRTLLETGKSFYLRLDEKKLSPKKKKIKDIVKKESQEKKKRKSKKETKVKSAKSITHVDLGPDQQELFDKLKEWRFETAKKYRTKAYLIFSNETLSLIARHQPKTGDELLAIKGVGSIKLADYGQQILKIVKKSNDSK